MSKVRVPLWIPYLEYPTYLTTGLRRIRPCQSAVSRSPITGRGVCISLRPHQPCAVTWRRRSSVHRRRQSPSLSDPGESVAVVWPRRVHRRRQFATPSFCFVFLFWSLLGCDSCQPLFWFSLLGGFVFCWACDQLGPLFCWLPFYLMVVSLLGWFANVLCWLLVYWFFNDIEVWLRISPLVSLMWFLWCQKSRNTNLMGLILIIRVRLFGCICEVLKKIITSLMTHPLIKLDRHGWEMIPAYFCK